MSENQDKWVRIQNLSKRISAIEKDIEVFDSKISSYNAGEIGITYRAASDRNFVDGLSVLTVAIIEEELKQFIHVVFQRVHDRLNMEIEDSKEEIKKLVNEVENDQRN